jgi:hypothetical protein
MPQKRLNADSPKLKEDHIKPHTQLELQLLLWFLNHRQLTAHEATNNINKI